MDLATLLAHKQDLALLGTSIVTIASVLANIFPKAALLGKVAHFLAINWKLK